MNFCGFQGHDWIYRDDKNRRCASCNRRERYMDLPVAGPDGKKGAWLRVEVEADK